MRRGGNISHLRDILLFVRPFRCIREVLSVLSAITAPVAVAVAVTAGLFTRFSHSRRTH